MLLFNRDIVREPLYAVVPLFNPWRWKSRIKHLQRALKHFHDSGATIVLVEIAFGRRELVFEGQGLDGTPTDCGTILGTDHRFRHRYIGLRTNDELWLKENAINKGVESLPYDWQSVCWLDGDVHFVRPNWAGECIQKLQHYSFLQMFSQARDMAPNYEVLPENYPHARGPSFVSSWQNGELDAALVNPKQILADLKQIELDAEKTLSDVQKLARDIRGYQGGRVFPGLAWAATRKAWDAVGGLPDFAIWGGADWHMAHALIGRRVGMMEEGLHPHYKALVNSWADRADRYIRRNVGTMEGAIFHSWHGPKTQRGYVNKHQILAKLKFDPLVHLKRDSAGLWQLHDDGSEAFIDLRDSFRRIAKERNEDSIDV